MPRKFLWRQPFGSRRDWGEHVVGNELQEALVRRKDDTTQVLVNCIIPSPDGGDREADFVVIGPYGATVIEVKNFAGPVQFDGQQGCINGTRKMPKDPRTQAKEAAQRLRSFFLEKDLRFPCNGLVLLASDTVQIGGQTELVCKVRHLSRGIREVLSGEIGHDGGFFADSKHLLNDELIERGTTELWGNTFRTRKELIEDYLIVQRLPGKQFHEYKAQWLGSAEKRAKIVRLQRHEFGSFRNEQERQRELDQVQRNYNALSRLAKVPGIPVPHRFFPDSDDDGLLWTAYDFVVGTALEQCGPSVPVLPAIIQAAETLGRCHKEGVVHRALTPACIVMVEGSQQPTILHFDFSRISGETTIASRITGHLRQLRYVAPEVRRRPHDATPAADVYSLGLIALELFARRSLTASSDEELQQEIYEQTQALIPSKRLIIERMVDPEPIRRIQNMDEVAKELGRLL